MSKHHVPIDNRGYNGLLSIRQSPDKNGLISIPEFDMADIIFSVIGGHFDKPQQIFLHITKQEAVQLANALHSLVVEIDREESKKDD